MYLAVTKEKEGHGLENIHIDDILFLETLQNRILVHTTDSVYYVANTLERWRNAFQTMGRHFELVDRSYIANLSKVKRLDPKWSKLYFHDDPSITGKPCNVARSNYRIIAKKIKDLK
ncbi:LytTR family DNA-binding domain-containing protein [Paenibacillus sp. GCM10012307]|uniref:LytTR family transcriptional regulator DNA-binding domain-containing protein n=1 Tax=Paenibacillus roseus TaxID=2798579 RepID=A0A934J4V5_9BACL|nr:LytTR family DNA-binding domain-containing protein [Paenibacillus roseus]MBJ6363329.1 LytTR family transcriptional regulator DNA-binding domain-containing protein [Paenibacillus roseus]